MASTDTARPLGRRVPTDWDHVEKFPLTADILETIKPTPVVIGINWYSNFDRPVKDSNGSWWIGKDPNNLGTIRGGHCVSLKERGGSRRPVGAYQFYDQGNEGACVGFGCSQMMSNLNGKLYFARWLWDRAKATDEWSDTNPGDDNGTSVRAGLNILTKNGHVAWTGSSAQEAADEDYRLRTNLAADYSEGISTYRWTRSIDDTLTVLGYSDVGYVDIMNSWGVYYPRLVRMPAETLDRLWREDGEVGLVTDR